MRADIAGLVGALEGLERRLFDSGAPMARQLRAGLSDGEIEVFTAGLPFGLSDELRCLYRWHDGVEASGALPYLPNNSWLRPLYMAVEDYPEWAQMPPFPVSVYEPTWFPIDSQDGLPLSWIAASAPGRRARCTRWLSRAMMTGMSSGRRRCLP